MSKTDNTSKKHNKNNSNSDLHGSINEKSDFNLKTALIRALPFFILIVILFIKQIFFLSFMKNDNPYKFSLEAGLDALPSEAFIIYTCFIAFFASFIFLFKGRGRIIYAFILDFITTLLTIYDLWYFRGFSTVPSILALMQASNLDNMKDSIFSMMSSSDYVFLLDFIVLIIYYTVFRKYFSKEHKRALKGFAVSAVISAIVIFAYPVNYYMINNGKNGDGICRATSVHVYFSTLGYHFYDCVNCYINTRLYEMTDEDINDKQALFDLKNENLPDNEYFGAAKEKNLIYIQIESFENFVLNQEINGIELTPNLNKLLENSIYFPNIYEQVWEGTSADCDFMINTGMLPLKTGTTFFRYPFNDYNSMPKILKNNGYNTEVIHPDDGNFWNYRYALSGGIGFDSFKDVSDFDVHETINMGISDEDYFKQTVPMIKELKEPYYVMTVTLTNHGPFYLPDDKKELGFDSSLDKNRLAGYFETVHYTDKYIQEFLDSLKTEGLLDNSIVVITGDHAGVHKYYPEDINNFPEQEEWFQGSERKMPFIIYDPSGKISPLKSETIGGQIDLMPTILYLLGIDKEEYQTTCLGRNLLNTKKSFAFIPKDNTIQGGENLTDSEKEIILKSWDISDKIIRSSKPVE